MTNIAIAGSTGYLGSKLKSKLLKNDYNVIEIIRNNSSVELHKNFAGTQITFDNFLSGDNNIKIDILINLICCYGKSSESFSDLFHANIEIPTKLYEYCNQNNVIFLNSGTVLPPEISAYAKTKNIFQELLKGHNNSNVVINLIIDQFYGKDCSDNNFITFFINELMKNTDSIELTKGTQTREFIYIDDLTSAFLFIIDNIKNLPVELNQIAINTKKPVRLKDFLLEIKKQYKIINPLCETELLFGAKEMRNGETNTNFKEYISLLELGWKPSESIISGISKILK
jgi:CDP-paratose synthetase